MADPYTEIYQASRQRQTARATPRGVSASKQRMIDDRDNMLRARSTVEQAIIDDRDNQLRLHTMESPAPDQVARQTRIAREANVAPAMVEDLDGAERAQNANRMTKVLGRYPAFGRWAADNPRGFVTAQDDHKALSLLGDAWEGLKNIRHRVVAGALDSLPAALEIDDIAHSPLGTVAPAFPLLADLSRGVRTSAANTLRTAAASQRERGRADNWYAEAALSGVESLPITVAAVMTRNPRMAAAIPALAVRGNALSDAREKGLSGAKAQVYAGLQGGVEYVTERLPLGGLADALVKKTPLGKVIAHQLATELPGEQVATALQDLTDWAFLPENSDKKFGDYLRARPQAALQTGIATVSGASLQTALAVAVDRAVGSVHSVASRAGAMAQARHEGRILDRLVKATEASKFNARDPDGYVGMIEHIAEETGVTHLYIPADVLHAYMQVDRFDPERCPFG